MKRKWTMLILLLLGAALTAQTHTLTVSVYYLLGPGSGASVYVNPSGKTVTDEQVFTFNHGETVELSVLLEEPPAVYCPWILSFNSWTGDWQGSPTALTGTITMDRDKTVTAECAFSIPPCTPPLELGISTTPYRLSPGENVSIMFTCSGNYHNYGGTYAFTLSYDPSIVGPDWSGGENIFVYPDGTAEPVTLLEPGKLLISPGGDCVSGASTFAFLKMTALEAGTAFLDLEWHNGPVAVSGTGTVIVNSQTKICGDINNDGVVTIVDALMLYQIILGLIIPIDIDPEIADVNCDWTVDIVDALLIAQHASGITNLNCCLY